MTTVTTFITGVSSDSLSFSWTPPVETGTTNTLVPNAYVICYSFTETPPTQVAFVGPLYEQFNMELLVELPGNNTSYTIFTTNPDFYQDAFWGIYPIYNGVPGGMFFAATYEGSGGFNRLEINKPRNMAIDIARNNIYFSQEHYASLPLENYEYLVSKLDDNKNLTHINGTISNIAPSDLYRNQIAINPNTNKLLRLGSYGSRSFKIYDLETNTLEFSSINMPSRFGSGTDTFVWNNKFFIRYSLNNADYVNNYTTGIFEVDTTLYTNTNLRPHATSTQTIIATYPGSTGFPTFYDRQLTHPTDFVNVEEGQIVNWYSSGGIVISKPNNTTIVVRVSHTIAWGAGGTSFNLLPLKMHIGTIGSWGCVGSERPGTEFQPINTEYWNTVIDPVNDTGCLGYVNGNFYNIATKVSLKSIDMLNRTVTFTGTHPLLNPRRVLRGGNLLGGASDYILASDGGSGIATKLYRYAPEEVVNPTDPIWKVVAQAASNEYLRDIVWSPTDNCFYATYFKYVAPTEFYDIKKITLDGMILNIEVDPENAKGEDKNVNNGDGDGSGGPGTGLGNNEWVVDVPEVGEVGEDGEDKPIVVTNPDAEVVAVIPVVGLEPNTVITFRKLADKFYLLQNGRIIWTYLLSPKELYYFTSTGYIGWVNRTTKEPIYTPPEFLRIPTFNSLYYVLDAVIEEPGYSRHPLFDGYPKSVAQRLVINNDDSFYIDRVNIEDDIKQAKYTFESGRKYIIAPNVEAPSPLLPRWVIDIIGASDYYAYIKEVELDS